MKLTSFLYPIGALIGGDNAFIHLVTQSDFLDFKRHVRLFFHLGTEGGTETMRTIAQSFAYHQLRYGGIRQGFAGW